MNYTQADAYATHGGTGHRMHQDTAPVPTMVTAQDINMLIWSLMKVVEDAGVSPAAFDANTPASYDRLSLAIAALASGRPGDVKISAASAVQTGWLECNGSVKVRATYAALFAAIGTSYNTGGEAGTDFRLPDLRGEFVRGWDNGRGADAGRAIGSSQADQFKTHSHLFSSDDQAAANFTLVTNRNVGNNNDNINGGDYRTNTDAASPGGTETRPRNVAMMYVIKT